MAEVKPVTAIAKFEETTMELVLTKVNQFRDVGGLHLPKDYSVENALRGAWLVLQDQVDMNKIRVLNSCTKDSIANALLEMCTQGLSVSKKQGAFIPYGNKLTFQREYAGTITLAKRFSDMVGIHAGVIYEGDIFEYSVNVNTGSKILIKHEQRFENIVDSKIKGAYAIILFSDGLTDMDIMPMDQIRKSWEQGSTKGKSPAHQNFPGEMAKKTVINRACKILISSSDDAVLMENVETNRAIDAIKGDMTPRELPEMTIAEEPIQVAIDVTNEPPLVQEVIKPQLKF